MLTSELSGEQLPRDGFEESMMSLVQSDEALGPEDDRQQNAKKMSDEELTERLENILLEKIREGNKEALFQLGQLYFEDEEYEQAHKYFVKGAKKGDLQAAYQLGVMYYDGIIGTPDHKNGVEYIKRVVNSDNLKVKGLMRFAQYNLGRAYFQGYGVVHSDEEAEKLWIQAADDGNPKASIKAQSMLGMFYSREETKNLKKAFFWHSEACGNGSLESQGALGAMYMYGLGVKKNLDAAFLCFREAAERGNVYAMANLIAYYYQRKLYTKCVELAARVALYDFPDQIAQDTNCLQSYISKGIAMACFYYARCLHQGLGVQQDEEEAKNFYSRSYKFDPDVCARLQNVVTQGQI